ncbi:hypothetical protein EDF46_1296 [Frondihabitans sp. PhB188]|nr:hypothetical protein [Frondihabitans sp. PhB188]ROQ39664.1 hypothetical protein EDF46_1296 [Frondihabitans sp. PhB188]
MTGSPERLRLPERLQVTDEWTVVVEDASFDRLEHAGREFLRAIRVVVRDRDWRTIPAASTALSRGGDGSLTLTAELDDLGVKATWTATLRPDGPGLRLEAEIVAHSDFDSNRAGLIVLHSPALAGTPLTVVHPDGTTSDTAFPVDVAPHQPARDIAGLRFAGGELRFEGDVFEMEDQRNWTDASFKTYSTPLSLPFPVRVAAGAVIRQSAVLTPTGTAPASPAAASPEARTAAVFPQLAVGAASAPGRPRRLLPWLAGAGILVELDLTSAAWSRVLSRARADSPGARLDVRLIAADAEQLVAAAHALCGVPVGRLAVYDAATHGTTPELWRRLGELAASEPLTGTLVGGTRAHFTELNRTSQSLPDDLAGVTFSVTAGMHDWSTTQKVESIALQRTVAEQAVRIAAGRPVHVGPISLRARFNAVATSAPTPAPDDPERDGSEAALTWGSSDPLQREPFFAAWLVASAAALTVDGVASLAFAEAWGPRGFGDADGAPYPAADALRILSSFQGCEVVEAGRVGPDTWAIAVRRPTGVEVVAANLGADPATVTVAGRTLTVEPLTVAHRDERSADRHRSQLVLDLECELAEHRHVDVLPLPRLGVEDAERADPGAVGSLDRVARVEAHRRTLPGNPRV